MFDAQWMAAKQAYLETLRFIVTHDLDARDEGEGEAGRGSEAGPSPSMPDEGGGHQEAEEDEEVSGGGRKEGMGREHCGQVPFQSCRWRRCRPSSRSTSSRSFPFAPSIAPCHSIFTGRCPLSTILPPSLPPSLPGRSPLPAPPPRRLPPRRPRLRPHRPLPAPLPERRPLRPLRPSPLSRAPGAPLPGLLASLAGLSRGGGEGGREGGRDGGRDGGRKGRRQEGRGDRVLAQLRKQAIGARA